MNKKSIVKAITVDDQYQNLIAKMIPRVKIVKLRMMHWYWYRDHIGTSGNKDMYLKKRSNIINADHYDQIQLKNEDGIKPNTGKSGHHCPPPHKIFLD